MKLIKRVWSKHRNLALYCMIGGSGAILDFIIYTAFVSWTHLVPPVANLISVTCGITNNYILNARFNFKTGRLCLKQYFKFYSVGLVGLGLSTGMIWAFTSVLDFNPIISKAITVFFITIVQYILNRYFTFNDVKKVEHE